MRRKISTLPQGNSYIDLLKGTVYISGNVITLDPLAAAILRRSNPE